MTLKKISVRSLVMIVGISMLTALGCSKPYIPPKFEPEKGDHTFDGLLTLLDRHEKLHVVWIHGMCPHSKSDWADPRVGKLSQLIESDTVEATDPESIGEFVYRYELSYQSKPIILDMLVWSELIEARRSTICFDSRKADEGPVRDACGDKADYPYDRAYANNTLKSGLLNACLADAIIYAGDQGRSIRNVLRPKVEAALATSANDKNVAVVLVSESLGSKVMFDVVQDIMQSSTKSLREASAQKTLGRTRQLVMFANQIPMLDLAGPDPSSTTKARTAGSSETSLQAFVRMLDRQQIRIKTEDAPLTRVKVVAFSDPNDVFSYRLPINYFPADANADVVNVLVSNDSVILGAIENPLTAHQGYIETDDVVDRFLCGNPVSEECESVLHR